MILLIRHKGLRRLYADDYGRGVNAEHLRRLRNILARLDAASTPQDLDLPGLRLHRLSGDRAGFWSVTVEANWRVIFHFDGPNATDLDYLDYH